MDRGGYQHHPALSLHLEKYKWLKLRDLTGYICLGILCGPLFATEAKVTLAIICSWSLLLQHMDEQGTQADQGDSRNLLDSRKQAILVGPGHVTGQLWRAWVCGLHQCNLRMLEHVCWCVLQGPSLESMESALHTPLTTPATYLRVKCISRLSTHFVFLKLLIVWHTGINSSDFCGVRVLLFECVRENVDTCLCVRVPMLPCSVK